MAFFMALYGRCISGKHTRVVDVAAHHHVADHALQAHALAIFWAVNTRHAIRLQLSDLAGNNDAAAAAKDLNVRTTLLAQQVHHVLEVLDVAALVRADGNALYVLLQGRGHDVVHAAVVP